MSEPERVLTNDRCDVLLSRLRPAMIEAINELLDTAADQDELEMFVQIINGSVIARAAKIDWAEEEEHEED